MEFIFLPLHLLTLLVTLVGVVLADREGFSWISGRVQTLNFAKLKRYHHWVGTGIALMVVTGFFLFYPERDKLLHNNPIFLLKMTGVGLLIINSFVIGRLMAIATTRPFASLSFKEKLPLFLSGAVSTNCWLLVMLFAFFILD